MFLDFDQDIDPAHIDLIIATVEARAAENRTEYADEFAQLLAENDLDFDATVTELYEAAFGLAVAA